MRVASHADGPAIFDQVDHFRSHGPPIGRNNAAEINSARRTPSDGRSADPGAIPVAITTSKTLDDAEAFGDRERLVVDGEVWIIEVGTHLGAVPEALVGFPPRRHRLVPLALIRCVRQIDVAERKHAHLGRLDHGNGFIGRVDDDASATGLGQRLAVVVVLDKETSRRGLLACQDCRYQTVTQRTRKREVRLRQVGHIASVASPAGRPLAVRS